METSWDDFADSLRRLVLEGVRDFGHPGMTESKERKRETKREKEREKREERDSERETLRERLRERL
jgi:hypothetical protein